MPSFDHSYMRSTFGLVLCDCNLLSWYPQYVLASQINNVFEAAVCSDDNGYSGLYPHILRAEAQAPCSHVDEISALAAARNFSVGWRYPFIGEINSRLVALPPDLEAYTESSAATAMKHQDLLASIRSCESPYFKDIGEGTAITGFELVTEERNGLKSTLCLFGVDIVVSDGRFAHTVLDLRPATEYSVVIRPLFLYFTSFARLSYVFGPASRLLRVTTLDDVPGLPPTGLSVSSKRDLELVLSWEAPHLAQRNGEVTIYRVVLVDDTLSQTMFFHADSNSFRLGRDNYPKLEAERPYSFMVSAQTRANGFGPFSSVLNTSTCPTNMRSSSTDPNVCFAVTGYFALNPGEARLCSGLIEQLPKGALEADNCLRDSVSVQHLRVGVGYWRSSLKSTSVRKCPRESYCQQTAEGSSTTSTPNMYCTANHAGTYCADCTPGHAMSGSGCESCKDAAETVILRFCILLFLICGAVLVLFLYIIGRTRRVVSLQSRQTTTLDRNGWKMVLNLQSNRRSAKARILLGYYQVLFAYLSAFQLESSNGLVMVVLRTVMAMDFGGLLDVLSIQCSFAVKHYHILLMATILPISVILALYTMCLVATIGTAQRTRALGHCSSTSLFILFWAYPSVSRIVLSTFWCEEFPEANKTLGLPTSALRADYRISCEPSTERTGWLVYAGLMVLVYPIGVIALYVYLFVIYSKLITSEQKSVEDDSKLSRIGFLISPYTTKMYWFEAYEVSGHLADSEQSSASCIVARSEASPDLPHWVSHAVACR